MLWCSICRCEVTKAEGAHLHFTKELPNDPLSDTATGLNPSSNPPRFLEAKGVGVREVLTERGKRYGVFAEHASITQSLKREMALCDRWSKLSPDKREALEMIAHKIGRILNGDPNYKDSWVDIAGYAQLVADTLKEER